ncbi:MAG: aconitase X catalytic domain-containing protein [Candidatus Bathyarchaeia archaeon]
MYLTSEEERILVGEEGPVKQKAMEILVALGEIYSAEKLIRVESAQVSGVSYKTIGDAGLHWLESLSTGRVQVPTTLNPAGMDLAQWRRMGVPVEFAEKQLRIVEAYRALGALPTCSCTPYLIGNRPSPCQHVAWSESSAVCYANSVLGAYTNREGGPSALASALTGRTPCYGYHLDENRLPTVRINVEATLTEECSLSVLGWWIGRIVREGVPKIQGLRTQTEDGLKALSAGLATTGSIAMFHLEDGPVRETRGKDGMRKVEKHTFAKEDLEESTEALTTSRVETVDLAAFGCPHASLNDVQRIAQHLEGRKVRLGSKLWVFSSSHVKAHAEEQGLIASIAKAGGEVYADTCMVVAPLERMGFNTVAVDSAKAATYLATTTDLGVVFGNLRECVQLVCDK